MCAASTRITTANPTEVAQERNIELGVCFDDPGVARGVAAQRDRLVTAGVLVLAALSAAATG